MDWKSSRKHTQPAIRSIIADAIFLLLLLSYTNFNALLCITCYKCIYYVDNYGSCSEILFYLIHFEIDNPIKMERSIYQNDSVGGHVYELRMWQYGQYQGYCYRARHKKNCKPDSLKLSHFISQYSCFSYPCHSITLAAGMIQLPNIKCK